MILKNKSGQLTLFIVVAIVLIAVVLLFFSFRDDLFKTGVPANLEPAYNSFLGCIEENTLVGIDVLESQGGYIELPDFDPASSYMPFSNLLDFLGNPVPYWYYVSGNNIQKEQVPGVSDMQDDLAEFLEDKIALCKFDDYYEQGFEISLEEPDVDVRILDNRVDVSVKANLNLVKGEDSAIVSSHKVEVNSKLGELYKVAKKVYAYEQGSLFLEDYAIDNLRLYAPVDGSELTCSPMVWNLEEVFDNLEGAIEGNTLALRVKGGDYSLKDKYSRYFVVDAGVSENVRFLNSINWPHSFEVEPAEGSMLIAQPVGNQPGMGMLGFCYVAYHYVYNMRYPVLVQIYEGDEIFQFPIAVVVERNQPRESLDTTYLESGLPELCERKNTMIEVNTYDSELNPIDAEVAFECFGTRCDIGETEFGYLEDLFPQCGNGIVLGMAEGYKDGRQTMSTIQEGSVNVILNKLYELDVSLMLDGKPYAGEAIVNFVSEDYGGTVVYPNQRKVELSEGQYDVQVYIYKNSSLTIPSSTQEQCVETPKEGLGALFGLTDEKCFDINIPSQIISNALAGGGIQSHYFVKSELAGAGEIEIQAGSLPTPASLEQLQNNYVLFESKGLDIYVK